MGLVLNAYPVLQLTLNYILPLAAFVLLFILIEIWNYMHKSLKIDIKEKELRLRDNEYYSNNRT